MSGLEGLGIACNILQIISYTAETARLCHSVYEGGSPGGEMLPNATALQALTTTIDPEGPDQKKPRTASEQSLIEVSRKCKVAAKAVIEEVNFLTKGHMQGNLATTLKVAAKTNWRKRRLKRLDEDLKRHQDLLETHMLVRVCKQSDASALAQQTGFADLDQGLQTFISQFAAGNTKLESLLNKNSVEVREHIDAESKKMQQTVETLVIDQACLTQDHINRHTKLEVQSALFDLNLRDQMQQSSIAQQKMHETLLKSFKFEEMNLRRNQLSEGHKGTFAWIWSEDHTDDESTSSDAMSLSEEAESPDEADSSAQVDESNEADSAESPSASDSSEESSTSHVKVEYWAELEDIKSELWNDFEEWLKSEDSIYWISGKPGSGKSTLMKYLIRHPYTMKALRTWIHEPEIISYFLWKPGSLLQRSLKGLLCTLLHQILLAHPQLLNSLTPGRDIQGTKESPSDWTVKELRDICLWAISTKEMAVCIFIDGLDEACDETHEDGLRPLLKFLERLARYPWVKLCVASRPEPNLQRAFSSFQSLRLQDLTRGDIRRYVIDTLHLMQTHKDYFLLFRILEKADGVFLWVRLALRNLQDGLELGDSKEELLQRLSDLPGELADLYEELWQRHNGKSSVYRKQAAQMLNLMLDTAGVTTVELASRNPVLLEMVAITTPAVRRCISEGTVEANLPMILKGCEVLFKSFTARCGGLAEIVPVALGPQPGPNPDHVLGPPAPDEFQFPAYVHYRACFIHRTAIDFLKATVQGAEILSHDDNSALHRQFLTLLGWAGGRLVQRHLTRRAAGRCIETVLSGLAATHEDVLQHESYCLIKIYWRLWNEGLVLNSTIFNYTGLTLRRPHFLSLLARKPELQRFVLDQLEESRSPPVLAAAIIGNLFAYWPVNPGGKNYGPEPVSIITDCFDFIQCLLSWLETMTNAPYFTILHPQSTSSVFPESYSAWSRDYIPFSTPLGSFLTQTLTKPMSWSKRDVAGIRRYLNLLKYYHPNYEEEICLVVEPRRNWGDQDGPARLYTSIWMDGHYRFHAERLSQSSWEHKGLAIEGNVAYWISILAAIVNYHHGAKAMSLIMQSIRGVPRRAKATFLLTSTGKPPYPKHQQLRILDETIAKTLVDNFTATWNDWAGVSSDTQTDLEESNFEESEFEESEFEESEFEESEFEESEFEESEFEESTLERRLVDSGRVIIMDSDESDSGEDKFKAMVFRYISEGATGSPKFSMHTPGLLEYLCDHRIGYIRRADLEAMGYEFINQDFVRSEV